MGDGEESFINKVTPDLHRHQGKLNAATISAIALFVPVMVAATPYVFDIFDKLARHDDAGDHLIEMQAKMTRQAIAFADVIGDQNEAINELHEALEDTIDQCREGLRGQPRRELGETLKRVRRVERLGGKQAMRKLLTDIDVRPEDLEMARAQIYDEQRMAEMESMAEEFDMDEAAAEPEE